MNDVLLDIAFGSTPGKVSTSGSGVDLSAPTASERWMRAVALGARGFYAGAAVELERSARATTDHNLRSLVLSTRASHLRQGGDHAGAYRYDGEAFGLVAGGPRDPMGRAAARDALIGLAADCLGTGRLDLAERLLARAATGVYESPDHGSWLWSGRTALRLAWVRTELSLYRGDATTARATGAIAAALAADCPSVRHRIKTDLIGAAVAAASGDLDSAGEVARRCATSAREHTQLPLEWAATSLLVGIGVPASADDAPGPIVDEVRLRAELTARGGAFDRN